ncbi:MAG: hypothetical protein QOG52_516 [Frankiaceae bacterium]|nr:hypothetical protein [Frankiaceae bacterium]
MGQDGILEKQTLDLHVGLDETPPRGGGDDGNSGHPGTGSFQRESHCNRRGPRRDDVVDDEDRPAAHVPTSTTSYDESTSRVVRPFVGGQPGGVAHRATTAKRAEPDGGYPGRAQRDHGSPGERLDVVVTAVPASTCCGRHPDDHDRSGHLSSAEGGDDRGSQQPGERLGEAGPASFLVRQQCRAQGAGVGPGSGDRREPPRPRRRVATAWQFAVQCRQAWWAQGAPRPGAADARVRQDGVEDARDG